MTEEQARRLAQNSPDARLVKRGGVLVARRATRKAFRRRRLLGIDDKHYHLRACSAFPWRRPGAGFRAAVLTDARPRPTSRPRPDALPADGEAARRADLLKAFLAQRQRMESLVSRWVGCRATAADLVQELFLRSGGARPPRWRSLAATSCAARATWPSTTCVAKDRGSGNWTTGCRSSARASRSVPSRRSRPATSGAGSRPPARPARADPADFPAQSHPRPHLRGDRPGYAAFPKRRENI